MPEKILSSVPSIGAPVSEEPVTRFRRQVLDYRWITMELSEGVIVVRTSEDFDGLRWNIDSDVFYRFDGKFDEMFDLLVVAFFGRMDSTDENGVSWPLWARLLDLSRFDLS